VDGAIFAMAFRIFQIKKLRNISVDFSNAVRKREVRDLAQHLK
jgi:hypothetical protein